MFVFNGDLILLESKWPVNSPIYYIKKLKPSVSIPLKARKLLFGSAVEFLWCFYYLNSRNNGWVSATCQHYPVLWSWKALLWRVSSPQPSWPWGSVSWETVLPCTRGRRDGGAWWTSVYGVTQSQTRLKWLSSSSSSRGRRSRFGMIQVHYMYCILYYYYISSTTVHQAVDLRG